MKELNSASQGDKHPKIVVLTGAGISAESGISTFRDVNGLWEQHRIEDVASPEAFATNPDMVHRFYDARRAQLLTVEPNEAHFALARLEETFPGEVLIITQNVDDLHERAGSKNVIHMHGELLSALCAACGASNKHLTDLGDRPACKSCGQRELRPDIVWFGENVRGQELIYPAIANCETFVVIGTSGIVYPAAGLVFEARANGAKTVLINLETDTHSDVFDQAYVGRAAECVPIWVAEELRRSWSQDSGNQKGARPRE